MCACLGITGKLERAPLIACATPSFPAATTETARVGSPSHATQSISGQVQTLREGCDWPAQMIGTLKDPPILCKEERRAIA